MPNSIHILQVATHGIIDNANPMYSRLVMSQSGVGEHEDGMLERRAALKLMESQRYRRPFYWTPFVVIGDAR